MADFTAIQQALVAHIKNPEQVPFEHKIEARRLNIYRELFFNNIVTFLSSGFPVLKSLYQPQDWRELARQFFACHRCRSPYFSDISLEFIEYLNNEHVLNTYDPPFIRELAHYEWLELSISIKQCQSVLSVWEGKGLPAKLQFSPLAVLVSYQYPVHQIRVDFQPKRKGNTVYLVVYRNREDEVNFTLVNQVTAHLLNVIQENDVIKITTLVRAMQVALPQLEADQLTTSVKQIVELMLHNEILLPANND